VAQYAVPNSMPVMAVPQFPTDLPQGRLAYVPPAVGSISSMGSATVCLMPQGKCDASSATGSISGTRSPRGSSTRSVGSSPSRMTSPLYTSYAVPPAASPVLPPQCEIAQGDNCHSWQRLSPGTVKPRTGNVPQMRCQISTSSTLSATSSASRETTPLRATYTPQVVRQSSCGPSTYLPAVVKIASTAPTEPTMTMPVVPGPDGVHSARFPTDHSAVSMSRRLLFELPRLLPRRQSHHHRWHFEMRGTIPLASRAPTSCLRKRMGIQQTEACCSTCLRSHPCKICKCQK